MKKALFQIENSPMYMGYTDGTRWNGWATPFFTLEEAKKSKLIGMQVETQCFMM